MFDDGCLLRVPCGTKTRTTSLLERYSSLITNMKSGNGHITCVPGQRLCEAGPNHIAGEGTYTFNKYIYSSLAGQVTVTTKGDLQVVKVTLGRQGTVMPEAGSVVTCRVLDVNPNQARVSILCVGPNKLHTPVLGTVRKLNVREHQVDLVEMYNSFRPDDIIIAVVLSLGDIRNYELSTAGPGFGVVTAYCEDGHPLVPTSWTTMRCKCRTERRKVARVMPPKKSIV